MISTLFSDVDRTLLTTDYALPEPVVRGFADARKRGIQAVLATARSPNGVAPICRALGIDYAICFNGGWIGRPLEQAAISEAKIARRIALSVMAETRRLGIASMWYRDDAIFTLDNSPLVRREAEITGESVFEVVDLNDLPGQPFKIMCARPLPEGGGFDALRARFSPLCEMTGSNWRLLEITPTGVSKGTAARQIADHLKLDPRFCAAAGDAENDLSLLRWAGTPVTVANAIIEIRDFAHFIGPHADEGGMAVVLDWLMARMH
ncbi:hypothetical protein GA0061105_10560 [Rhizobium aethiopicum]|uniref:Cof subfamily of IIB subfamily of haloacid dehalogenase superfamily/HAD-superfamily hydrolase, subfamily IIB n=1 Tax=Rhizobium aethiopicum TaxID=1138170 RepID=A0A1C3Y292_9HYPH|nr:HAD family hydrolase [Rhizobium aethiopicum]SCB58593.1 hypothetical protein GA0061105_10560 [Rhizobium aethiopicum]